MTREILLARSVRMIDAGGWVFGITTTDAQKSAEPIQKVLITDSRIASPAAEAPSPLRILSSADSAATGANNLRELFRRNPAAGTLAVSWTDFSFLATSSSGTGMNPRNLGDLLTSVLINGRRFVSGVPDVTAVGPNIIPANFIEGVALITGGGFATYGSNAITAVINIISKKNFNCASLDSLARLRGEATNGIANKLPKSSEIDGLWLHHNGAESLSSCYCWFFDFIKYLYLQGRQRLITVVGRKNDVSAIRQPLKYSGSCK